MTSKTKIFFRGFFVWLFILAQIFVPNGFVFAISVDSVKESVWDSAASYFEKRYHLNKESLQDQGENINVSAQKGTAPQVSLFFSPSDPKPGMEVEARAFPQFFANAKETLYFTWYLKRKGCDLDKNPSKDKLRLCDRNDDKEISVEDWKVEAMQTVAARNFDATCSLDGGLSAAAREDCAKNMYRENAPSRINPSSTKGSDKDKDGYRAAFGGDGQVLNGKSCNAGASSSSGGGSSTDCEITRSLPDLSSKTLYVSEIGGSDQKSITLSPSQGLYETAYLFNEVGSEHCYEIVGSSQGSSHGPGWCSGNANWGAATEYISPQDDMLYLTDRWRRTVNPVSTVFPAGSTYKLYWRDSDGYDSACLTVGDSSSGGGSSGCRGTCYVHDFETGYNHELTNCKHLFPKSYERSEGGTVKKLGSLGDTDGAFPIGEEHFWYTDPEDPSTAQNGNKDEANLVGLGQDAFKWIYAPEDKIGVAVEGTSMYNTKKDDSSSMVMWALPKNKCEVKGKSTYTEKIKGYDVTIRTSTTDIDDCLEDNLVDPSEGGQAENMEVSLGFSPENPSARLLPRDQAEADATPQTGDTVTVNASTSNNSEGPSSTNYVWRVYASKDGTFDTRFSEKNVWTDISCDLLGKKECSDDNGVSRTDNPRKNVTTLSGNNVDSIAINLNLDQEVFGDYFKDDTAYFRIVTSATENFSGKVGRSGTSSLVIKVVVNKKIDAFGAKTVVGDDGMISVQLDPDAQFCPLPGAKTRVSTAQQTICPVIRNQIVAVRLSDGIDKFSNFSWTVNGESLICTRKVSKDCAGDKQGAVNFFPISGNVGDLITVTLAANETAPTTPTKSGETGKSFIISRRFQIVDPGLDIVSDDTEVAWPKFMGQYKNLDGSETSDMSTTSFEGIPSETAKLSAIFRPELLGVFVLSGIKDGNDENELLWSINGQPFKQNDTSLSIALDGNPGDIYNISLSGSYNQSADMRKALYDIWNISPFNSGTEQFSRDIQIRLVVPEGGSGENARGPVNAFFASIISAVPPLVIFSVRLILSWGLILLIMGMAFSVVREAEE